MKRNILKISLVTLIGIGCLSAVAKKEVTEGDWNDGWGGNPGNIEIAFKAIPDAGFSNLSLVITVNDPNAKIMWTTEEGILPDDAEGWKEYKGPITLTEDCTVSFYAVVGDKLRSDIMTYKFVYADHQVAAPVINANTENSMLTIGCATPGAEIRYTEDGSEPTKESPLYTGEMAIKSYIYRARAFAEDLFDSAVTDYVIASETVSVAVPVAEFSDKLLTITCPDEKAEIYFTTDSDATIDNAEAWQLYEKPLALTENCLVRFFGRREGFQDSDIQSFSFIYSNYRAADPTIERNYEGTHIVMATATEGGVIRYTTDGTEPTADSPIYTEPILIECNGTFMAKTFADGLFDSETNRYIVSNMAVSNPFANFSQKHFNLTCIDTNAAIWYTTDADATVDNTDAWTLYSAPFSLSSDCTLRFFARRENFNDSDIESLTVVIANYQLMAPSISRNAQGTHIIMTAPTQGPTMGSAPDDLNPDSKPEEGKDDGWNLMTASVHYTTDGSEPTLESPVYESPIRIQENTIFKARAFDENWLDSEIIEYQIGTDHLNAPVGVFENFALKLTTEDEGAQIWYTDDLNLSVDDVDKWKLYEAPITLESDCSIRFFAGDDEANASDVQMFVYQKADYTAAAPTIERNDDGAYIVMATDTEGAEIRYTMDGSEPTKESYLYTDPVLITCNATFRAKTFKNGLYESETTEFIVSNIAVSVPRADFADKHLTLTCDDSEAQIWYSMDDDATPENDEAWTVYTEPVALEENCFVHFFSRRENMNDSDIETFVFLRANYMAAAPSIERSEDGTSVSMATETEGGVIRYTTDGSEPTENSAVYEGPIFVTVNCTFRAKVFADGLFESPESEFTVSNLSMVAPIANYENDLLIITVWDDEATIWYTTDADATIEDESAWTLYTEPLSFNENCIVRFFARREGLLDSEIMSYEIAGKSGVADTLSDSNSISVIRKGADIIVNSPEAGRIAIYTVGGQLVRVVNLIQGENVLNGLSKGTYIIAGKKVIL